MAFAPERDATARFLDRLAADRQAYNLPPRLRELAERFIHRALELLFPHFAAEVGGRAGDVADELAALRALLADALRMPGSHCDDPDEVVDMLVSKLPAIREALLLDAQAIYEGDPAARSVDEVILAYPGFYAVAVYRIAHELHSAGVPLLPRMLTEQAHRETGIDIHPGARIGRSLAIDHGTGIVIGETAILGDRVKLYQGVTLGALSVEKHMADRKRHPTIGDDVVIYANATILGGDTVIGSGSVIGGNVWLTRSVPANSIVTPTARIDRRFETGDEDEVLDFNI
jgi:serine O-acetyltransferase